MSIQIGTYHFDGPFRSLARIEDQAGVYAVLDRRLAGESFVLDAGESATVKSRLETHDREGCWRRNAQGTIEYAVLYTPGMRQSARHTIEQELRDQYRPACGVR